MVRVRTFDQDKAVLRLVSGEVLLESGRRGEEDEVLAPIASLQSEKVGPAEVSDHLRIAQEIALYLSDDGDMLALCCIA